MLYSNNDIVITVPVGIQIGFIKYTSAGAFVSWSDFRTQNTIRWQILIPKKYIFQSYVSKSKSRYSRSNKFC